MCNSNASLPVVQMKWKIDANRNRRKINAWSGRSTLAFGHVSRHRHKRQRHRHMNMLARCSCSIDAGDAAMRDKGMNHTFDDWNCVAPKLQCLAPNGMELKQNKFRLAIGRTRIVLRIEWRRHAARPHKMFSSREKIMCRSFALFTFAEWILQWEKST